MTATYVIGDIHGHYEKLVQILRRAGFIGPDLAWTGGSATLWFMGDYFDRGPDGISVIDLIMRLQEEAPAADGKVGALLGNHDPLLLSALYFGEQPAGGPGGTFRADWLANGGMQSDLDRLRPEHIDWLSTLPAMALAGGRLLVHADAEFYLRYGRSVSAVNETFGALLQGRDASAWDQFLADSSERFAFTEKNPGGADRAKQFLRLYGGAQLVHGHTPIFYMSGADPAAVSEPYIYADGLCVNVDHGLYRGGAGFAWRVPD